MRGPAILASLLLVALVAAGVAQAAPGDPYVVYTANTFVDGAVILRTDPADGSLVEISRNGPQGNLFQRPFDLALEADGDIVVADMGTLCTEAASPCPHDGRIVRVDPLTGSQTLVSSGGQLVDPAGIAVGPGGALYVVDNLDWDDDGGVIRVDQGSGAQSLVARNDGNPLKPRFDVPFGIAFDRDGSLLVTNRGAPGGCSGLLGSVIRVNPATGGRSAVASGGLFNHPFGLALDTEGRIVFANECGSDGLVRLSLSLVPTQLTPNTPSDALVTPERIALDPNGDLLVSDYGLSDGDGGIVKVASSDGGQSVLRSGELFNHPLGIAAVVNRPPTAALSIAPPIVAAGRMVRLDASGSRDPDGLALRYAWDLDGDGGFESSSATAAVATVPFNRDGTWTVHVRVDDPHGGSAVAGAPLTVDGRMPVITRLRAARVLGVGPRSRRHRPPRSTKLRFRVSEPGSVSVEIRRARSGRRDRTGACVRRARRGRRCVTWPRARVLRHTVKTGSNAVRVRARGLRPGRFRLILTAIDRVGNRSASRILPLRVVRLRR